MAFINLGSSMKYGPSGKRRKTTAWNTKKKTPPVRSKLKPNQRTIDIAKEAEEHRLKYPSLVSSKGYTPTKYDDSYKKEASKNFTVAIGYNKGGYQVIPNSEIKDIGK
tara:strand:+ start:645 stop:968 length:324 start_codon:yes stop_codon:yes gene_type:complete